MNEGLIARRYASAMLKVAEERRAAGEVYERMKRFEENYVSHPDLHKALVNPLVPAWDKEALVALAAGVEGGELFMRGVRLLLRNHREMYIRSIGLMYQQLYRKAHGIGRVRIISVAPLDVGTLQRVKKLVLGSGYREVELLEETDLSLIGGFVVQIDSHRLDCSVRGELRRLAEELDLNDNHKKQIDHDDIETE